MDPAQEGKPPPAAKELIAKFDIESSSDSETAEDPPGKPPTVKPGSTSARSSDEGGNMATISLDDTPPASSAPSGTAVAEPGARDAGPVPASNSADGALPATQLPAAGLPVKPDLPADSSSRTASSAGKPAAASSSQHDPATEAADDPPAVTTSHTAPAAAQASPVKVWVRDAEKVQERSRLGVAYTYITCLVHTECSSLCALAAATGAASGHNSSSSPTGAASSSSSRQQQQPGVVRVFEVRRRFDDFDALSRLLKSHYRGYFIPRLPPSDWLTGGDNFLKTRRVDLQDYLLHVSNHPVLQASDELRLFLTAAGDLTQCTAWQNMLQRPAPVDALLGLRRFNNDTSSSTSSSSNAAAGGGSDQAGGPGNGNSSSSSVAGGGGVGMMLRMKHSIMSVVQPKSQPELPADEQQLQQAKEWLRELQHQLSGSVNVVRSLVSHLESVSEDFEALGKSFSHFARFEEALAVKQGQYTPAGSAAVQRGADLQRLGYGALRQHSLSKQFVVSAGASLVFLPDYHSLIPECIATLQEREDALAACHLIAEELRDKQAAAAKLCKALGPAAAATDKKVAAYEASIQGLKDKLVAADQQYRLLKERNQAELVRLDLQRADDFTRALGRFAAVQAQAAAAAADVWSGVAEQFAQQQQQQQLLSSS